MQIAERSAEERDEAPAATWNRGEMSLEVADDAVNGQLGIQRGEFGRAPAHHRLVHVERHVPSKRSLADHGVEERERLRGSAGAELDELIHPGHACDCRCVPVQQCPLTARRVVLGKLRDPIEQLGAARIVEVLRRKLLLAGVRGRP